MVYTVKNGHKGHKGNTEITEKNFLIFLRYLFDTLRVLCPLK